MYAWFVLATALQVSKLRKYCCGVVLGKRTDTGTIDGYCSVRRGGATVRRFWDFGQVKRECKTRNSQRKGEKAVAEGREDGEEPSQGIATSIEVLLLQLQLKFGTTST
jgi:hypothetical protein